MPRNLPNGQLEYNIAIEQEKIEVIEKIISDLTDYLMCRLTFAPLAELREICMNSDLSQEQKEADINRLQTKEKARIMAAYATDKESLRPHEITQAYIFELEKFNNPAANLANLIKLFHEIRADIGTCYSYFCFDLINDPIALIEEEAIEGTMDDDEEFIAYIEHRAGEGSVIIHSEYKRLRR